MQYSSKSTLCMAKAARRLRSVIECDRFERANDDDAGDDDERALDGTMGNKLRGPDCRPPFDETLLIWS